MSHQFSKKARKEPFVLSLILSPELLLIYVMFPVITPAVTDAARLVRSDPAIAARARKGNAEPLQHRGVREEAGCTIEEDKTLAKKKASHSQLVPHSFPFL